VDRTHLERAGADAPRTAIPAIPAMRLLPALLALLVGGLAGCTRDRVAGASTGRVRLVDRLHEAVFESAIVDPDDAEFIAATTRTIVDAAGADVEQLEAVRFTVARDALHGGDLADVGAAALPAAPAFVATASGARVPPSSILLLPIATLGDRDHEVALTFAPAGGAPAPSPGDGVVLVETAESPTAESLGSPDAVVKLFAHRRALHFLAADATAPAEYRASIRTAPDARTLVLAIMIENGGTVRRVAVGRRTRSAGLASGAAAIDGDPRAQRVMVGDERRESILFAAPGGVTFEFELPATATRLTLAAAPVDRLAGTGAPPRLAVAVASGSTRRSISTALATDQWAPLELDVSEFAGRSPTFSFRVTDMGGERPFAVALGAPTIAVAAPRRAPDVVLVSLDTLRYDRTGIASHPRPTTPHLDGLAREAAVFRAAFAGAAYTLPSHATIFSGRLPDAHGVNSSNDRYDVTDDALLAVGFRNAGYVTAGFTAGGYVRPEFGLARGFERYRVDDPGRPEWRRKDGPFRGIENESLRQLESFLEFDHGAPLFAFVHTYAAHDYWAPGALFEAIGFDRSFVDERLTGGVVEELRRRAESEALGEPEIEQIRMVYDGAARLADETLGRVLELLSRSHRDRDTIVVVLSDHGEELFERGRIGHGFSVHDEMLHVPLVIRGPGILPGTHDLVVSLADVAPTLRDLARIAEPASRVDGRSLLPVLRGASLASEPAYARVLGVDAVAERALRSDRHKLRISGDPAAPTALLLHDLVRDAGERFDVAAERPEIAEGMLRALQQRHREQVERTRNALESSLSPETVRQLRELGYLK
jgi:arylsulfatase A-like enzyme